VGGNDAEGPLPDAVEAAAAILALSLEDAKVDNELRVSLGATATADEAGSDVVEGGRLELPFERKFGGSECQWSFKGIGSPSTEGPRDGNGEERVAAREVRRAAIWRSNSAKRCKEVRRVSSGIEGVGTWGRWGWVGGIGRCRSDMWTSWVATKEGGEATGWIGQSTVFVGKADGPSEEISLRELDCAVL
jgi:hypothetical protein